MTKPLELSPEMEANCLRQHCEDGPFISHWDAYRDGWKRGLAAGQQGLLERDCRNYADRKALEVIEGLKVRIRHLEAGQQGNALSEWEKLKDPIVLHANLLRGFPAQLTVPMLRHLLGDNPPPAPLADESDDAKMWRYIRDNAPPEGCVVKFSAGQTSITWGAITEKEFDDCLSALRELHAMVWGECPSLLNEDSGGCGRLDREIEAIIARELKGST